MSVDTYFKAVKGLFRKTQLTPKLTLQKTLHNRNAQDISQNPPKFKPTLKYAEYRILPHPPIPDHIPRPPYAQNLSKQELKNYYTQTLPYAERKTPDQISKMRTAAKMAAQCLKLCVESTREGVTPDEVDRKAHEFIIKQGAYPSGINFHGFPRAICSSVNEVACHGIPDTRPFVNGDIVTYDLTVYTNGVFGDTATSVMIGEVSDEIKKLVRVSKECCDLAIDNVKPGVKFTKLAELVTEYASKQGFSVVWEFGGHFIGSVLHMPPMVQYATPSQTPGVAEEGNTFTIEPILCQGDSAVYTWDDGWTIATVDNGFCSQFEHTVLVTSDGCEILTIP